MKKPKVSVVMPVYNSEKFLRSAIESILNQTFSNFEFIIINDGSTDTSHKIISSYRDKRIKIIKNKKNIGLAKSLNKGIKIAKGEYIARMDADDISNPTRLEKQVSLMTQDKSVDLVGSWARIKDTKHILKYPIHDHEIKTEMIFNNPFVHSSVMVKSSLLRKNLYNPKYIVAQDFELWSRIQAEAIFSNIPEILITRREHPHNVSNKHKRERRILLSTIYKRILSEVGVKATNEEIAVHMKIFLGNLKLENKDIKNAKDWIAKLKRITNSDRVDVHYLKRRIKIYTTVKAYTSPLSFINKIKLML